MFQYKILAGGCWRLCSGRAGSLDEEIEFHDIVDSSGTKRYDVNNRSSLEVNRGYLVFSVKDQNLFYRVDTISNIFTSGTATSENITDGVHEMK